jgi:catechol 2,3-dioxygenase-like lactoylglutathione lyase family enzyme
MLEHIFLSVKDIERSIEFYTVGLAPLGITTRVDDDASNGPPNHPDLKSFGDNGRTFFWLQQGSADNRASHVGFIASNREQVESPHAAAIAAGATDKGAPGIRLYYDPRYYAANVLDPDGYSSEFAYKSWQH